MAFLIYECKYLNQNRKFSLSSNLNSLIYGSFELLDVIQWQTYIVPILSNALCITMSYITVYVAGRNRKKATLPLCL